jgi:hypothetical protein
MNTTACSMNAGAAPTAVGARLHNAVRARRRARHAGLAKVHRGGRREQRLEQVE